MVNFIRSRPLSLCRGLFCEVSIHALRAEGDADQPAQPDRGYAISIHALRVEGDLSNALFPEAHIVAFLSTTPVRRATYMIARHRPTALPSMATVFISSPTSTMGAYA